MSEITGTMVQRTPFNPYTPHCNGGTGDCCSFPHSQPFLHFDPCEETNGIRDWKYKCETCSFGPCKPGCSKPNANACDLGGNAKGSVEWTGKYNYLNPEIKCTYQVDSIDSIDQINKWISKFGKNKDYDKLMQKFCTREMQNCTNGNNICSFKNSNSTEGKICQSWYNEQKRSPMAQTLVETICNKNPLFPECKCINRALDPIYGKFKNGGTKNYNDGCWYIPCTSEATQFIPRDLYKPICPDKLCQNILSLIDTGNVDISGIQNTINCDFSGALSNKTIEKPVYKETKHFAGSLATILNSLFSNQKYAIIVGGVLIASFTVLLLLKLLRFAKNLRK